MLQESGFRTAPRATIRYRFARALATRINAPAFTQSPSFPACYQPGPDLTLMLEPRTLVLIPARMAATRLPGKPLLEIAGLPMIVHVLRRAEAAQIARVAVATDTPEISSAGTAPRGAALPSCRPLCLSPRGAGALRCARPVRPGAAGEARTAAGARGGDADRYHHRRYGAARGRHAGRPRNRPLDTGKSLSG